MASICIFNGAEQGGSGVQRIILGLHHLLPRIGGKRTAGGTLYPLPFHDVENMHELRRGGNNKARFFFRKKTHT
jgi:hypothetical protein